MRLPQANKATTPTVPASPQVSTSAEVTTCHKCSRNVRETCHHCGRTVSDRSCRQEIAGWFCWQNGLILGEGVELFSPEPEPRPWLDDPAVIAATAAETAANEQYDAASVAWEIAIRKLAEHGITSGGFHPAAGNPDERDDTRARRKLVRLEAAARTQRDTAAATLMKARVAHRSTLEKARRATTPLLASQPAEGDGYAPPE